MQFPQLRGSKEFIKYPCFVEHKYDGEANYYIKEQDKLGYLVNKYGRIRNNLITAELDEMFNDFAQVIVFGELYVNGGIRGALYDLLKHKENDDMLHFACIEMVSLDDEDIPTLMTSKEMLNEIVFNAPHVHVIPFKLVDNEREMEQQYMHILEQGYEGAVVKWIHSPCYTNGPVPWTKIKYKDQSDFEVVHIDPVKDRIEVSVENPEGKSRRVGVKCTPNQKRLLRVGGRATVEHQGFLSQGGLRHPVFIANADSNGSATQTV